MVADGAFERLLSTVEHECRKRRTPWAGLSGVGVERVWSRIHAAEVMLVEHSPPAILPALLPRVRDEAGARLPATNAQLRALDGLDASALGWQAAQVMASALQAGHVVSAAQHRRVRSFRNTMYGVALFLLFFVAVLIWVARTRPQALPMCSPDGQSVTCVFLGSAHPHVMQVAAVAAVGAAAGVLSGVPSLRRVKGTSTPYSLLTALWVLKAPSGALSAILGLLLLRGELVSGLTVTTSGGLMAWAVVFGTSQQLLTRLADSQGQRVLEDVHSGTGDKPVDNGA